MQKDAEGVHQVVAARHGLAWPLPEDITEVYLGLPSFAKLWPIRNSIKPAAPTAFLGKLLKPYPPP